MSGLRRTCKQGKLTEYEHIWVRGKGQEKAPIWKLVVCLKWGQYSDQCQLMILSTLLLHGRYMVQAMKSRVPDQRRNRSTEMAK